MAIKDKCKVSKEVFNSKIITWPGTIVCVKSLFSSTNLLGVTLNFSAMEFRVSWLPAQNNPTNKIQYIKQSKTKQNKTKLPFDRQH